MYQENMLRVPFKDNAIKFGGISETDLERLSEAWGKFGIIEDAWITVVFCEMIAVKSE
jgi:hypothetical protein